MEQFYSKEELHNLRLMCPDCGEDRYIQIEESEIENSHISGITNYSSCACMYCDYEGNFEDFIQP